METIGIVLVLPDYCNLAVVTTVTLSLDILPKPNKQKIALSGPKFLVLKYRV